MLDVIDRDEGNIDSKVAASKHKKRHKQGGQASRKGRVDKSEKDGKPSTSRKTNTRVRSATRSASAKSRRTSRSRSSSKSPSRSPSPKAHGRSKSAGVVLAPLGSPQERAELTRAVYMSASPQPGQLSPLNGRARVLASLEPSRPTRRRNETLALDLERRINQLIRQAKRWTMESYHEFEMQEMQSGKRRPRPPFDYAGAVLKLSHDFESRVQEPTVHRFLSSLLAIIRGGPLNKPEKTQLRADLAILGMQAPRTELFAGLQQLHKDAMADRASEAARALRMLARMVLQSTEIAAATRVQALTRGHLDRKLLAKQAQERRENNAASKMQALARGHLGREHYRAQREAAVKIQAISRGRHARNVKKKQIAAATKIEALARGKHVRREVRKKHQAATKLQSNMRGKLVRTDLKKKKVAATKIEALARGRGARVKRKRQIEAATKIQAIARGHHARQERKSQETAVTKIQAAARGHNIRKKARLQREESARRQNTAAVKVQAAARGRSARQSFKEQKQAATKVQALARGHHIREEEKNKRSAATKVQALARGHHVREEEKNKVSAATKVQALSRGHHTRQDNKHKKLAATKIEAMARGHAVREHNIKRAQSAQRIQAVARGHVVRSAKSVRELASSPDLVEGLEQHVEDMLDELASEAEEAGPSSMNVADLVADLEQDTLLQSSDVAKLESDDDLGTPKMQSETPEKSKDNGLVGKSSIVDPVLPEDPGPVLVPDREYVPAEKSNSSLVFTEDDQQSDTLRLAPASSSSNEEPREKEEIKKEKELVVQEKVTEKVSGEEEALDIAEASPETEREIDSALIPAGDYTDGGTLKPALPSLSSNEEPREKEEEKEEAIEKASSRDEAPSNIEASPP